MTGTRCALLSCGLRRESRSARARFAGLIVPLGCEGARYVKLLQKIEFVRLKTPTAILAEPQKFRSEC